MIVLAIMAALIALWRPIYGLAALIVLWPSYLIRGSVHGIPTTALEVSLYAVAAILGLHVATKRLSWHWVRMSKLTWTLLGLWVIAWIFASFAAADHRAAFGAMKAWLVDPLLFIGLLTITIRTEADRRFILLASAVIGTIVALAGLIQLVAFRSTLQEGRLSSFFAPVANYAAMFLGPLIVLIGALLLYQAISKKWWIAFSLMVFALVATLSFGAFLAVAMGSLIVLWSLPRTGNRKKLLLAGLLIAIIGFLVLTQTKNFQQHFNFAGRSSGAVREQIWVTSWALITQHPILGVGPNNFESAYRTELPKHYFPPLEWLVSQPHNLYLALWLETGLLGLIVFILLFINHVWILRHDFFPNPHNRVIAVASLAAMITVLVHGLVDTPYFKNDLAMEFLFLAVLPWLGRKTSREILPQHNN